MRKAPSSTMPSSAGRTAGTCGLILSRRPMVPVLIDRLEVDARMRPPLQRVEAVLGDEVVEAAAGDGHGRDLRELGLEGPQGLEALLGRAELQPREPARLAEDDAVV